MLFVCRFFFSSRRRHTRLVSDWSSDVCSSDLLVARQRLQKNLTIGHALDAGIEQRQHATIGFCRSEEHTSELQSLTNLVCRLLLEKKKKPVRSDECTTEKLT